MIRRSLLVLSVLAMLTGSGEAGEVPGGSGAGTLAGHPATTSAHPQGGAVIVAQDASCANACQAQHDQCRVATKGSPSCDGARQRCLQACIANKKK